ncbi:MAG TPA: hypothetical protein PLR76_08790 [Hyphomonas sp.]|nr:hypothetical protein [Hyphomonas sp.]
MADGEARPEEALAELAAADVREGLWSRVRAWRQTPFIVWALVSALALTGIVFWHTFTAQHILESADARTWFLAATAGFWLPLILLLRDSPDNFAQGPSLRLPLISLGLTAALTATVAIDFVLSDKQDSLGDFMTYSPPVVACIASVLVLALVPLAWNAANLARYHADQRKASSHAGAPTEGEIEARNAEAMGALVATLFVGGVIAFAICAGIWNDSFSFDNFIGAIIGFLVVGAFGVVIFIEPLSDFGPVKWLSRVFGSGAKAARPLAATYDAVDTFLVRIVAVMGGMEHRTVAGRYGILGGLLTCFCLLGWYLPPRLGLIPCVIGLLMAISVSRLWSWVEDDRALAALTDFKPTTPYRTDMREDYRDETLLGFAFVFFLIPIMMRDAHWSGYFGSPRDDAMFKLPAGPVSFLDWFGYFGIALAKAVPIVDWAEIYNFGQPRGDGAGHLIDFGSVASRHAVFMARATVDLVLIASLLQAISITGRNRQQKRLYKAGTDPQNHYRSGLIDRLDPFVEKTELRRAMYAALKPGKFWPDKSTTAQAAHDEHFDLRVLSKPGYVDFRHYNAERLAQMHAEYKDPVARAFIAAISYERPDFSLVPRLVLLDQLAEKGAPESELYTLLKRIENDLAEDPRRVDLSIAELRSILLHTAKRAGLKDFKRDVIALLQRCTPKREVIEHLADVAGRSDPDAFQYARVAAVQAICALAQDKPDQADVRFAIEVLEQVLRRAPGQSTVSAINNGVALLRTLLKSLQP